MKTLLIGRIGQLGWEIIAKATAFGVEVRAVDLPEFNITDSTAIKREVGADDISVVINASAYTAVDKAETEQELAYAINSKGPGELADVCQQMGKPLIHVSTDYVFDGKDEAFYAEDDPTAPIGVYGKSKFDGEERIRKKLKEHIIVRTSWLYSCHGNNFVKTMLRLGKEREILNVVNDQFGCPTWAADLAEVILTMVSRIYKNENVPWGTYHFCGAGVTSWYEFAKEIFHIAGQYESLKIKSLNPIPTSEYPTPAKRPQNSSMTCSLLARQFDIQSVPWQKSLKSMLDQYFSKA